MSQISATDLNVSFAKRSVLSGINLQIALGQVTVIVGPNGAGKSTLLDCLAGLRKPDRGEVRLGPQSLASFKSRERAKRIAYLPQYAELAWEITGSTLVGLGRTPHTGPWGMTDQDSRAIELAMQRSRTTAFADRVVSTLSGGERGRLFLARALATEPEWLLADEPLAGLDPGHCLDVLELFRSLAHDDGRGVLLTMHDLTMALRVADRVIVLNDGSILADGDPQAALPPEVLKTAYGIHAELLKGRAGYVLEIISRA